MDPNEPAFDLDRYLRVCGATKPECFDWTAPQPRLSDDALFTIAYMMDIESHTIVYLRDLLSTRVVRDNEVTAFLSCWAYEEFFHSLLLRRFLATQEVAIDDQRFADLRSRTSLADRIIRPGIAILSRVTRHFPAVHMTFGAINEISTLTGYQALISRTDFAHDRSDSQRSAADDNSRTNHQGRTPPLCFLLQSGSAPASRARRAAADRIVGAKFLDSGRRHRARRSLRCAAYAPTCFPARAASSVLAPSIDRSHACPVWNGSTSARATPAAFRRANSESCFPTQARSSG